MESKNILFHYTKPMNALTQFKSRLPAEARRDIEQLKSPYDVQEFLQNMAYKAEVRNRSPLNVMLDKQCHCLDGGFLGALLLWKLGFKPLVIDIVPDPGMDDDHVLALYQIDGRWGAVAKTNYINLGFREAVHKTLPRTGHDVLRTLRQHPPEKSVTRLHTPLGCFAL